MKPAQKKMLADRFDKLMDIAAMELDVTKWPGAGKEPTDMTQEERGDRVWCKKDVTATLTIINKINCMLTLRKQEEFAMDEEKAEQAMIKAAERESRKIIERLTGEA